MSIQHPWRGIRPWKRHSLVLMVAGLVYIAIGWTYLNAPPTESRLIAIHFALNWLPYKGWGFVFILAGLLSVISSRWPPVSETWGYTVLSGLSGGWAAVYLCGIWFWDSPASNYSGVLSWGLIAFMWWAISGLTNPTEVRLNPYISEVKDGRR